MALKQTWGLQREFTWEMAHALTDYQGPCARIHGHSWKAAINVEFAELNHSQMGVDFSELKQVEKWVNDHWDHRTLLPFNHPALQPYILGEESWDSVINEIGFVPVPFNPTCERLSAVLATVTADLLQVELNRVWVKISETSKNSCMYTLEPVVDDEFVSKAIKTIRGIHTDEESFIG